MQVLTKIESASITGGRPPLLDELMDGINNAKNIAAGPIIARAIGGLEVPPLLALEAAARAGWYVGTALNDHVIDPYIVQPWIMRQSN